MTRPTRNAVLIAGVALMVLAFAGEAAAGRCATGLRSARPDRFTPLRPVSRRMAPREVAPVPTAGAHVFATEHFRVLWGDDYPRFDPDWLDLDRDGVPRWVEEIAAALEAAYADQVALGFPAPYGSDRYYLDAYVGNTGVRADGQPVTISSGYYAYTEIDTDYDVAYFVFNSDFSAHTGDESGVLRVTAAHELFHAVQRAMGYPWDDEVAVPDSRWRQEGWWFEATATWMEEVCEPQVDDYVTYVRSFLSTPEEPMRSTNGVREYGAAIFPGYLWLRHGGPDLWVDVFSHALAEGLEPAIRASLAARDGTVLEDAVAAFWSLAAHPEDFWTDGAQFRTSSAPRLVRSAATLPVAYATSAATAPGRFGANLVSVEYAPASVEAEYAPVSPGSARVAVSGAGDAGVTVAELVSGSNVVETGSAGGGLYIAVVNTSGTEGDIAYSIEFTSETTSGGVTVGASGEGGGGGGCFISTLRPGR